MDVINYNKYNRLTGLKRGGFMKVNVKKICYLVLFLTMFYSFLGLLPLSQAADNSDQLYALDFSKADDFISRGKTAQGISNLDTIGKNFTDIGSVLVYFGAGILVAGLGYIGIMYMVSPPEKQGKLKQQLVGLLVSGIVIFGAYSIWSILIKILSGTIDN